LAAVTPKVLAIDEAVAVANNLVPLSVPRGLSAPPQAESRTAALSPRASIGVRGMMSPEFVFYVPFAKRAGYWN
jgi:hypothetical protein